MTGGLLASGSNDSTVIVWNATSSEQVYVFTDHDGPITALASIPNNVLASGSADTKIILWNITTGSMITTLVGHIGTVRALQVLGESLLSGSEDGGVKVWNPSMGVLLVNVTGGQAGLTSLAVFSNGRVVSGSKTGAIVVFNINTGQNKTLHDDGGVYAMNVLQDGQLITASDDHTITFWNKVATDLRN